MTMANIEALRLFVQASAEYPASVTAIAAYSLREAIKNSSPPFAMFELANLELDNPAISAIIAAARVRHGQAGHLVEMTPTLVMIVLDDAYDRAEMFTKRQLNHPQLTTVLDMYHQYHSPRHTAEDEAAYFYAVVRRYNMPVPVSIKAHYQFGRTIVRSRNPRC